MLNLFRIGHRMTIAVYSIVQFNLLVSGKRI